MERLKKRRRIASGGVSDPAPASSLTKANIEFKNFETLKIDSEKIVILDWWREMKSVFPIISKCAREVLSIPVSSSSSERAFSFSGQVMVKIM